jgi:hypothetical protein
VILSVPIRSGLESLLIGTVFSACQDREDRIERPIVRGSKTAEADLDAVSTVVRRTSIDATRENRKISFGKAYQYPFRASVEARVATGRHGALDP